ncbi:MAG TPA: HipA domain-containing protein [Puia sp.]|jgi:serine/threonine-protein kinase HipA|nr:HipA domain-containing protein [Puia sp.]
MDILVYADWKGLAGPVYMGVLSATHTRGNTIFAFSYDQQWIKAGMAQGIDPDLRFYNGPQYAPAGRPNFGIFLDSSPDRWGRVLMDRREALLARKESRKPTLLFEEDYLLGVYDDHRMGALRFRTEPEGPFLNNNKGFATPPWTSLRELEFASNQLEKDKLKAEDALKWINMLIAPGASLGGARPKAGVTDEKGQLWIAKFPSIKDQTDIGAWEMVVNELAAKAGITIAKGMARIYGGPRHTFLSQRFDRTPTGERLHFASAMTLLGQADGAIGASYLHMAEFILRGSASPNEDLDQLWRRIVFYIAVRNTDDHLRNHGFLLTPLGWRLSPAYDINPVYSGTGLTLNISETDNALDFDLARSVARYFRVADKTAASFISHTRKVVGGWQKIASRYKISRSEQEIVGQAFE